jgi:hypothetical protein
MDAKPNHTCPLCNGPNACAPARSGSLDTPCWCTQRVIDRSVLARIPDAQRGQACVCAACGTGAAR